MVRTYQRRQPENTVLYRVVQNNLATFVARAEERGRTIPWFVRRELESYLDCGILARGFVRVFCESCKFQHLVALSCCLQQKTMRSWALSVEKGAMNTLPCLAAAVEECR